MFDSLFEFAMVPRLFIIDLCSSSDWVSQKHKNKGAKLHFPWTKERPTWIKLSVTPCSILNSFWKTWPKKKRTWTKWYVILLLLFSSYTKSYLFILNLQSFWEFFGKQKRMERIYIYIARHLIRNWNKFEFNSVYL